MNKPDAPAARRNREAIQSILEREFAAATRVLEIGSGTGQHAVYFAGNLPHLEWQTSDLGHNHAGIRAWLDDAATGNALPPLSLDMDEAKPLPGEYDAVFSANTAHIMSADTVVRMFGFVGATLLPAGRFCLYGPFNVAGAYTSESNAQFDRSLKAQDAAMGIRDLDWLVDVASRVGLMLQRKYAMPANNMLLAWEKHG